MKLSKTSPTQISVKWIISLPLMIISLPFLIFPVGFQETRPEQTDLFWKWITASSIGLIPTAFVYAGMGFFYFKRLKTKTAPISSVFLFGLLLGGAKGFGTGISSSELGLLDTYSFDEIMIRTLNSAFIGMVFVPAVTLLASSYSMYILNRRKLIDEYMNHEFNRLENESISSELRSKLSQRVDKHLVEILKNAKIQLKSTSNPEVQWEQIAKILRDTALNAVRPLSHDLWKKRKVQLEITVIDFFKYSLKIINFKTSWIVACYVLTTFQYLVQNNTLANASLNLVLRILLLFFLFNFAQVLKELLQSDKNQIFLVILTFVCLVHFGVTWGINHATHYSNSIFNITDTLWIFLLALIAGVIQAFLTTQEFAIEKLEDLTEYSKLSNLAAKREVERFSRDIAKYLHGTMQSRLMASAMSIENAAKLGDKVNLERQIELAFDSLEMPSIEYLSKGGISMYGSISEVIQKWDGLVEIAFNKEKGLATLDSKAELSISEILDEALANAFRHGKATKVRISLYENENDKLELEVTDDGLGPQLGNYGMGSQLFSSYSENWRLKQKDNSTGSVLQIELSFI